MGEAPRSDSNSRIDYQATLDCVHCGLCLPHCPTYQETGREGSSPRGRIYLIRGVAEGRLALDRQVAEEMFFCLGCRACESACPAGVRFGSLIESMRAEVEARAVRGRFRRILQRSILRGLIGSPRRLRAGTALLRLYQGSGLQKQIRRADVLRRTGALGQAERMLPPLADRYRPPLVTPAEGTRRGRVAFFSGCIMPEFFGPANRATIEVLARNGFEVTVPRNQCCCGALQRHNGDPIGADRLLRANRRNFTLNDVDAIIVNSAGCGAELKQSGGDFSRAVRDVSEFLHEVGLRPPAGRLGLRVAYDDPCHLLHAQRIREAPRALLRAIPGVRLEDLPDSGECCGAAGIYNLTHPRMATRLLERKLSAIRELAPDVVTSGNPGCLLQIGAGVREAGLEIEVIHPIELLARAYGRDPQDSLASDTETRLGSSPGA